jgi:hypothetical protein
LSSQRETRRKLYKLYVYSEAEREDPRRDDHIIRLAQKRRVEVVHLGSHSRNLMDKMSGGRPHNGYVLVSCGSVGISFSLFLLLVFTVPIPPQGLIKSSQPLYPLPWPKSIQLTLSSRKPPLYLDFQYQALVRSRTKIINMVSKFLLIINLEKRLLLMGLTTS